MNLTQIVWYANIFIWGFVILAFIAFRIAVKRNARKHDVKKVQDTYDFESFMAEKTIEEEGSEDE